MALVLLALAVPTVLWAIFPDPGPDSFGLYGYDESQGWANCIAAAPGLLDMYIVLAGPTQDCVGAWGLSLHIESNVLIVVGAEYFGPGQNWELPPDFMISLWEPLPVVEDHVVLARLTFLLIAPDEAPIYAGPPPNSSVPQMPFYVNCEEPYVEVGCAFATDWNGEFTDPEGWLTVPLAQLNGEGCNDWEVIETETTSWSTLKEMYR